jgi:hypothetical protein
VKKASQAKLAVAPAKSTPTSVAQQPKLDPMEVNYRDLTPEQQEWVRAELLAHIQRKLANMEACRLRSVAWCVEVEEADRGCITPAEDFIGGLVMFHHYWGLTPDRAAEYLEEFRDNFDEVADAVKYLNAKYPTFANSTRAS